MKRTFTQQEKDLVYDLWKQGAGFSDIGRVIEAKGESQWLLLTCIKTGKGSTTFNRLNQASLVRKWLRVWLP